MGKVSKLSDRRARSGETPPRGKARRVEAIAAGRCPRCDRDHIFARRLKMHDKCPTCGLAFNREPGYFAGAMYISYALALPIVFVLATILRLIFDAWSLERVMAVAAVLFLPFVPFVFRYSRILWIHFDRAIDPEG